MSLVRDRWSVLLLMALGSDYPLPRFGQGAFRAALESVYTATTGQPLPYTQFGKPYPFTYAFAHGMLRDYLREIGRSSDAEADERAELARGADDKAKVEAGDVTGLNAQGQDAATPQDSTADGGDSLSVYMVGDNPESDIAGANGHGWKSILVRTGVYRDDQGEPRHQPTIIQDDVEQGVYWAIEREVEAARKTA